MLSLNTWDGGSMYIPFQKNSSDLWTPFKKFYRITQQESFYKSFSDRSSISTFFTGVKQTWSSLHQIQTTTTNHTALLWGKRHPCQRQPSRKQGLCQQPFLSGPQKHCLRNRSTNLKALTSNCKGVCLRAGSKWQRSRFNQAATPG